MALRRLAAHVGISTSHVDGLGRPREASDAAILSTLRALGIDIERAEQADSVLSDRLAAPPPLLAPCNAFTEHSDTLVPLRAGDRDGAAFQATLTLESGEEHSFGGRCSNLPTLASGARGLRLELLPVGYHRLAIEIGGERHTTHVMRSPVRAYGAPDGHRSWSVFAPLYALRSEEDFGIGDFASMRRLMRWSAGLGARYVGTLPLLAGNYREDFQTSPYSPVSRLFWNEIYLDLHELLSLYGDDDLAQKTQSDAFRAAVHSLQELELVDYRQVADCKRELLETLSKRAWARDGEALERFAAEHPRLASYARFRATMEKTGTTWQCWGPGQKSGALGSADYDRDNWQYHVFAQYCCERQLARLGNEDAALYLDLNVGVNGSSFDRFCFAEQFAEGAAVGAPPDGLFEGGQNWGLTPLHPERCREQGHDYFVACIRNHMRHAGMLRIDHIMGLHRLYWIPDGLPATEGLYVHYPADELYGILCIESHRASCAVTGEDLGTVPDYVRPAMLERGIHNLYVGMFSTEWREPEQHLGLQTPPHSAVASIDTHDTDTFAGWFETTDLTVDPNALMRSWSEELAASPAASVMITLEDLWLEREPQNVPGTFDEYPNWRRRMRRTLSAICSDGELGRFLQKLDGLRRGGKQA